MTDDNLARPSRYYKSRAEEIPSPISTLSPEFDDHKCWHCQEFPRIKTKFNLLIWCQRCYILQGTKHDGTRMQQTTMPIAQDLEDIRKGKVEVKAETAQVREIVVES